MGFRFRRSVRLLPGIRLNFGTRGVSTSVGGRGFTLNFGKRGIRTTVGIPGTGISYSEMLTRNDSGEGGSFSNNAGNAPAPATGSSFGWGTVLFIIIAVVFLTRTLGGPGTDADNGPSVGSQLPEPVASPVATSTAVVTAQMLKCRVKPNAKARVLQRVPRGTMVRELERQADWVQVEVQAIANSSTASATLPVVPACWVSGRFLRSL